MQPDFDDTALNSSEVDIANLTSPLTLGTSADRAMTASNAILSDYGVTITSCGISDTAPIANEAVTLSGTAGQVHGATGSDLIKVVIGFRDGSGNWVGGEPVVISNTVPGLSLQPWSGSSATINAPSVAGTY